MLKTHHSWDTELQTEDKTESAALKPIDSVGILSNGQRFTTQTKYATQNYLPTNSHLYERTLAQNYKQTRLIMNESPNTI